jgi:hypothetical protein
MVIGAENPILIIREDGGTKLAGLNINFIQITTTIELGIYDIVVDPILPKYKSTGLQKKSMIRCWNIVTIHRGILNPQVIGYAGDELELEVKEKLRARLSL